jgi:hypothetical protein
VGQDFSSADKGRKFAKGGDMMSSRMKMFEKSGKDIEKKGMKEGSKADMALDKKQMMRMKKGGMAEGGMSDKAQDKAMIKKAFKQHDMQEHKGGKGTSLKLAKGGTSNKFKRYAEGGEVDESAAKQRGLDISNKEAPVGFFERIRMGNIDQPGTEAYNRFGAGRGYEKTMEDEREAARAPMRTPSTPSAPAASSRPLSDDMYSDYGSSTGAGAAGTSETVKPTRQVMVKPTLPASSPTKKPTPESMPVPPLIDRSKPVGTGNQRGPTAEELAAYSAEKNKKQSAAQKMDVSGMKEKAKSALHEDPTALLGAAGAAGAGYGLYKLAKNMMGATKAGKVAAPFLKEIGTNPPKKLLEGPRKLLEGPRPATKASEVTDVVPKSAPSRSLTGPAREDARANEAREKLMKSDFVKKPKKPLDESDTTGGAIGYKRGGKTMKYASGGMVSSVSKRADGIASKGKTRCKIC